MAHISADRVKETTTTTGTGSVTLDGAVAGFKAFSDVCANNDTVWYCIAAQTPGEWEVGLGTYVSATPALARTTVLSSSNSDAAVNFSAGTKDVFITLAAAKSVQLDNQPVITLQEPPAAVQTPTSGTLSLFARTVAGRVFPKYTPPSGLDTALQASLFLNRVVLYVPSTGSTGTGSGTGLGPVFIAGGTVNHPTPSTSSPAITNQMRRTRYVNAATSTNQGLGIRYNATDALQFWTGNSSGLGGFYYAARFIIELYPASTIRLFAGLSSALSNVVFSDTVSAGGCGLWHDTTDPSSGSGAFNFLTCDGTTATKQAINLSNAIAAGNSYDFFMFCPPNSSTLYWELQDIVNNVTYTGNTSTTLPTSTTFMGPQCMMSNGTAHTTVSTVGFGIVGMYVESDR